MSRSHSARRLRAPSKSRSSLESSLSSGSIFSSTNEYWICALTQAAKGAAAMDTLWIVSCLKESDLLTRSWRTCSRIVLVIVRASKVRISLMTDPCDRKRFMLIHDVSWLFISRRTPSSTSRIGSGGSLKERISFRLSFLMLPTACLAASSTGMHSESWASTSCRFAFISVSFTLSFDDSSSASCFFLPASARFCVMSTRARSAWSCFSLSISCCCCASRERVSTIFAASSSLLRPPPRNFCCLSSLYKFDSYKDAMVFNNVMYCLGAALFSPADW